MQIVTMPLHPLAWVWGCRWSRAHGKLETWRIPHQEKAVSLERLHPVGHLIANGGTLRVRLAESDGGFSDLAELHALGFTDYLGARASDSTQSVISFATTHPEGFSELHLATLEALMPIASLTLDRHLQFELSRTVLHTYLGMDAGERVLRGQIRRGDGETVRAAIWVSDLRDFTPLSDRLPRAALLSMLDDAFEAQVGAIEDNGGQVLKFMGDGLLATFSTEPGGPNQSCASAVAAALAARERLKNVNERRRAEGSEEIRGGLALYLNEHYVCVKVDREERPFHPVQGPAARAVASSSSCVNKPGAFSRRDRRRSEGERPARDRRCPRARGRLPCRGVVDGGGRAGSATVRPGVWRSSRRPKVSLVVPGTTAASGGTAHRRRSAAARVARCKYCANGRPTRRPQSEGLTRSNGNLPRGCVEARRATQAVRWGPSEIQAGSAASLLCTARIHADRRVPVIVKAKK